jgi:putative phage-type endonuclease
MIKQNTKDWLEMRKSYVGASDAPVIMGVSPWRTPYQLWQEKLGIGEGQKDSNAMKYGRNTEEEARTQYQLMTGNFVEPQVIFHPTIEFMMASLDGVTVAKDIAVEIKCPGEADHALALEGTVPEKYVPQLQHQLACLDINLLHYFSYRNGAGCIIEVKRDDKYIGKLIKKEIEFWEKVQKFEAPDLTERDLRAQSKEWIAKAQEVFELGEKAAEYKKLYDEGKKELEEMCAGESAKGGGVYFKKSTRIGGVVYKNVPQLIGVDLDQYRGKPVESWRLSKKEE